MTRLFPVALLITLLPFASGEEEASGDTPSILEKSPFLPPDFQPPGRPGQATPEKKGSGQLEFRGVYELGGIYHYNLYDAKEKKGYWVTEATAADKGFDIVEFDPEKYSLVLMVDGEPTDLSLVETSNQPMQIQGMKSTSPAVKRGTPTTQPSQRARRRVIRPTSRPPAPPPAVTQQRRTVNRTNPKN